MALTVPPIQRVTSERLVSSSVIGEEFLAARPEEQIQYVEVPVVEEIIRHVPRREIVEIEKKVPKYEYQWVDRVVEVPQIQVIDKYVEVPQIEEVIRRVPRKEVVEVPKQVIRHVPKIETKIVEKLVEVPGELIEVPKPYLVENKVIIPRYVDRELPTVVSQKLVPIISESDTDFIDIELREYNPKMIPVDVYVPRPVRRDLMAAAKTDEHQVIDVPAAQFNALVRHANPHLTEDKDLEGLLVNVNGYYPMIDGPGSMIVPPVSEEWREGHVEGKLHWSHNAPTSMPVVSRTSRRPVSPVGSSGVYGLSSMGYTTPCSVSFSPSPAATPYSPVSNTNANSTSVTNAARGYYQSNCQGTITHQGQTTPRYKTNYRTTNLHGTTMKTEDFATQSLTPANKSVVKTAETHHLPAERAA